jgi:D-inositol-3-phosphate glycosyltransferase
MFLRAAAVALEMLSRENNNNDDNGTRPGYGPLEIHFVIAGVGTIESELRELSMRLLSEGVKWLGHVPNEEVACVLREMDVFVFSSLFEESFGMSPVEAMLMGVPVIGFGVGGSQDFLINGVTGVLVEERSPEALGRAMVDLARDEEKRQRLRDAAEEYVRGMYDPWNILSGYERMYEELMLEKE